MSIYFASDMHLGLKFGSRSIVEREKSFVRWLESIAVDCDELFLVGDVFDFFFEWKRVVPKGYFRTFTQLASMSERGIKIHFFVGNHDFWLDDYFTKDMGLIVHREPLLYSIGDKNFYIAHGDIFYRHNLFGRVISFLFRSGRVKSVGRRIFHPDFLMCFGHSWSLSNRQKRGGMTHIFGGEDDFLVKYARSYIASTDQKIDYFVFGHEHTPIVYPLTDRTDLVILGEWIEHPVVARFENSKMELIDIKN